MVFESGVIQETAEFSCDEQARAVPTGEARESTVGVRKSESNEHGAGSHGSGNLAESKAGIREEVK